MLKRRNSSSFSALPQRSEDLCQNDYFFKQFITLPLLTTAQVPAEIQNKDLPHDVILSPLCFTVDMMCYVVFAPNIHFKIMAKMFNYGP